ncbi:MAG: type IV secretory system conjugative DNA transfer family protein [Saprospiraceae bacterium]|nr:type IV secretory system conjugative DNA transfer family protein [Saprospiraceae bacterium]
MKRQGASIDSGGFFRLLNGMFGAWDKHRRIDHERRVRRSIEEAQHREQAMLHAQPSGVLGDARPGNLQDAAQAGLLTGEGLYLGLLDGHELTYNGDASLLTYGRPGVGKDRDIVAQNAARNASRSMIFMDPKSETSFSSARFRREVMKLPEIVIDPYGTSGLKNIKINPLARLVRIVHEQGRLLDTEHREIAAAILPKPNRKGESDWANRGARRLIALIIKYQVYHLPNHACLGLIWNFLNTSDDKFERRLDRISRSTVPGLAGETVKFRTMMREASKQFEAIVDEAIDAIQLYEPGSSLREATRIDEFDFAQLKQKPHTVYVTIPGEKLDVASRYLALIFNHIVESVATAKQGSTRTTFLLNEFANIGKMPSFRKALRLYRGAGVQFFCFAQSRQSVDEIYGEEGRKELEECVGVLQALGPEEPSLLRDLELWSGKQTVIVRAMNRGGGAVASAGDGIQEQARPVLQIETIRTIGDGRQILKLPGSPLFVAERLPWFEMEPYRRQLRNPKEMQGAV